jgi:hypothetical protein
VGGNLPTRNPEVTLMTIGTGRGKRLANVARSCGLYMYHGLLLIGQSGMHIWYTPYLDTRGYAEADAPNPSLMFSPVEVVPRIFTPASRFAEK